MTEKTENEAYPKTEATAPKSAPRLDVQVEGEPLQADVAWPLEADRLAVKDPLLESLAIVAGMYGKRMSVNALAAGLPLARTGMSPSLFIRAAERASLSARLVERSLNTLAIAPNLPCVLVLGGKGAAILKQVHFPKKGGNKGLLFDLVFPETPSEVTQVTYEQLLKIYIGQAFFIRPIAHLDERAGPAEIEEGRDWFWSALKANKSIYIEVVLAAIVINIIAALTPLFTMNVYDRVVPNSAFSTLWVLSAGITFAYIFDLLLKILRSHFLEVAGRRADVAISSRIFEQVMALKMTERPASAGVQVANMREFDSLRDFFTSATLIALVDLPFALFFIAIIAVLGGPVVFAIFAAIPIVIGISLFKQRHMAAIVKRSMAENAMKNAILYESVTGLETVKVQAAEGHLQRQWEQLNERASKTSLETREISSSIQYWVAFVIAIAGVGIIILGTKQISEAKMTTGALIACYMLSTRAMSPLAQIAGLLTRFQQTRESFQQLNTLMKKKVERPKGKHFIPMQHVKGRLDFRGVTFNYPKSTIPALKNMSFTIQPGEHVGIIGAVGSGKTTMQRLILNLYEPNDGAILLDGTDVRQIDPGDLRRSVGVVQQRPQLFFGSIRQNITMGHETVSDAAIMRAAELAGVMDFLRESQAGLDTQVGERGEALSGGQQQSVAIARALLYDPSVLILDEPTASLDPATENRLLKRLHILTKDRTVILITHKGPMLQLVDRLMLMDKGVILGDGPRDTVLQRLQNGEFQARRG